MTRRNRETVLEKENRYENSRPGYDRGGCFVNVRPAAHVSSGCKSRIRPVVGRI
ncbi:Uncharacterised protein [uncultured Clostridium sp.]|nr:Uncharacterised protein [uncultured Clostridium sp.]